MYTKILATLDGSELSEQVLPYAQSLAAGLSLPVALLCAVEPEHLTIPQSLNPGLHAEEMAGHRLGRARDYVELKAAGLRGAGLRADTVTPVGEAASAIVAEADTDPGALIAMSSHGRSGLARWWMGSVTDKVLHLTANPMLIVRAADEGRTDPGARFERVIVPVDGSELAEEILPYVVYLSAAMGLAVDLVRVNPSAEEYYRAMSVGPAEAIRSVPPYDEYIAVIDGEAAGYLDEIKGRLMGQGAAAVATRLLHGRAADSISDLASATDNNLVAMTTHGRSGVGRLVLGSVAERVTRQSGDPVLLVRGGHGGVPAPLTGAPALA